jgi:hypothetical protein
VIRLKNTFSRYKKYTFAAVSILFLLLFILFCYPIFDTSHTSYTPIGNEVLEIKLDCPKIPKISDYFIINIKAKNNNSVDFPVGSVLIRWKYTGSDKFESTDQQRFKIFIDGYSHNYYIPIGENRYWANKFFDSPNTDSKSNIGSDNKDDKINTKISSIKIDIPDIDGVEISINKIQLKRRLLFPLDSYINYFFKSSFNINYINRFLTPTYIFLALLLIGFLMNYLLFKNNKIYTSRINKTILFAVVTILVLFSFYFLSLQAFTVKSYWDSYRKYIISGDLENTYLGFYDFEKFISWVDEKIPKDDNLIVLVRGEPIYVMSEMSYNLYPRDIKFVNISNKEDGQILDEIININSKDSNNYKYVIALSEDDSTSLKDLNLIFKYRENSGFIYKINI